MQLNAYCIYDNKALVYGVPFFASTDGSAIRSFGDLANSSDTTVGNHPRDFSLFCVGFFDDQNGGLSPVSPLRHVIDATALIRIQNSVPFDDQSVTEELKRIGGKA